MKIQNILKRLLQLHPKGEPSTLARIKRLLKDLNSPEKKIDNLVQVVGTNGKHSFCVAFREIIEEAGYKCNLNISPSLRKFNERFYILGKYISDEELYSLLNEVEKINDGQSISFHEIITAAWILQASRNQSDINIMEAGALFRLDSSNVFKKNLCSVVMPIDIDHRDFLKKGTIDEIVYEKCSHLLPGSKIIISEQKKNTLEEIKKNISKNSSKKLLFGKDYNYKKNNNGFVYKDYLGQVNLPSPNLIGDFQISNVATAIAAARSLDQFKITKLNIRNAITKIRSEGRLQIITKGKLRKYVSKYNQIIIDGAHNPLAALVVRKYLDTLDKKKKVFMILGMMANKEHKKFIQIFKNRIHSVITLDIPNQENFLEKKKLSEIVLSCGIPAKSESSIKSALKKFSNKDNKAIIFCTGSLYFSGEILNLN